MSDFDQNDDPNALSRAWDDDRITAFVMGELSSDESAAFEEAMSGDSALQSAVDEATRLTDELQDLYANESPNKLDDDRRQVILAANDQPCVSAALPEDQDNGIRSRAVIWVLAAAAAVMLMIGIVPAMQRSKMARTDESPDGTSVMIDDLMIEDLDGKKHSSLSGQLSGLSDGDTMDFKGAAMASDSSKSLSALVNQPTPTSSDDRVSKLRDDGVDSIATGMKFSESIVNHDDNVTTLYALDGAVDKASNGAEVTGVQRGSVAQSAPQSFSKRIGDLQPKEKLSYRVAKGKKVAPSPAPQQPSAPSKEAERFVTPNFNRAKSLSLADVSTPAPGDGAIPVASSQAKRPQSQRGKTSSVTRLAAIAPEGEAPNRSLQTLNESKLRGGTASGSTRQLRLTDRDWFFESEGRRQGGDRYDPIVENEFKSVSDHPLSTFSIDVDTASYSKVRRTLAGNQLPQPDAVRIEEMVNYFDYQYSSPDGDSKDPVAAKVMIATCPWNTDHRLARVAIQGKEIDRDSRPPCNLVFLLDTSGSMNSPNKLPLVIEGMKMLTEQLNDRDRVAIVVYAGSAGMVLDSTSAKKTKKIKKALSQLSAGGSTAGGAGIQLAYATARDNFIKEGVNRVILCTDGDFNVGIRDTTQLVDLVKEEASGGIFLTALGFGMGNHNDAMMEQISGEGNGNYAFIDTPSEACKVLVRQTDATLVTIAKDVKLQLEFNPRLVSNYRLIGYENRVLAREEFNDDKKDAGEIGAGHQVTALYELVPANGDVAQSKEVTDQQSSSVGPLKYQSDRSLKTAAFGNDAMTFKLRYKLPDGEVSTLVQFDVKDSEKGFAETDSDFQFAASVASFGMLLRNSRYAGDWTLESVHEVASSSLGPDEFGLRREFVGLVTAAQNLAGRN